MADIKTILRETSVIFGLLDKNITGVSVPEYIKTLKENLDNFSYVEHDLAKIVALDNFSEYEQILEKGYNIGIAIMQTENLKGKIKWLGREVNSEYPFDLMIGDFGISLKEHSYILKNPALADYLNSITQYDPPFKVVHVFRHFAPKLFSDWFTYTINKFFGLQDGLIYNNEKRNCILTKQNETLIFKSASKTVNVTKAENISEIEFNKRVGGALIEYTFSKWINENMDNDAEYIKLKKLCSVEAGNRMKTFVLENQNIKKDNILGLFQIYSKNYVYAKTGNPPIILEVPSINEIDAEVIDVEVSVPKSQLNMLYTIRFSSNEKFTDIQVRAECRYSHGQFNGTPEAKLYYCKDDDISKLYKVKLGSKK